MKKILFELLIFLIILFVFTTIFKFHAVHSLPDNQLELGEFISSLTGFITALIFIVYNGILKFINKKL